MSLSERVYRILIQAYPKSFRHRHEEELLYWFRDHQRSVGRQGVGRRGVGRWGNVIAGVHFWRWILCDLLTSVPTQHVHNTVRRHRSRPHRPLPHRHLPRRESIMGIWFQDARIALRSFARMPAFFALAVVTLALGVGFATTLFSVIDGVLLKPLPYPAPERIVRIGKVSTGVDRIFALSAPDALDLRARNRSFEALAVSCGTRVTLAGEGEPEVASGSIVSSHYFAALGVQPTLGRAFLPEEDAPGVDPVAIVSHGLWQRQWGGDPSLVGRAVPLGAGRSLFTVVGIMPADFRPPDALDQRHTEIWLPFALISSDQRADRRDGFLMGLGRLRPGVSLDSAHAELAALGAEISASHPENRKRLFGLSPLHRETVSGVNDKLWTLFGAVGLLLAIACTNVANLLLVRAGERGREMAVRASLGAGRGRLGRQLLTESLILGLCGGGLGALVAGLGVRGFVALSPVDIPRLSDVAVDGRVLVFTVALSVTVSLLFGLVPAIQASRVHPSSRFRSGVAASSLGQERLRSSLVVGETTVALVLVVGAGLLINSFVRLHQVDPGFNAENVHVLGVSYPGGDSPEEISAFYAELTERIAGLPGVTDVGATPNLPLSGMYAMHGIEAVEGRPDYADEDGVYYQHVSSGFFQAMGIDLIRGRGFGDADRPGTPRVVVINRSMARQLFGTEDPLGRRIQASDGKVKTWYEIIGVAADVRSLDLTRSGLPEMYMSFEQEPRWRRMDLIARTATPVTGLLPAMRAELRALRPDLPVLRSVRMEDHVSASIAGPRFYTLLLGTFAGAALVLALVGIYGTLSYAVSRRAHEFGIRMAVGASAGSVHRLVLLRGMKLVGLGVTLGLGVAWLGTRALESLVFGISPTDPSTLALGVVTVLAAAFWACSLPAWRAARLDPIQVLRSE